MATTPTVTALYGIPLPTKRRAVFVTQAQVVDVEFQFLDGSGNPVDLLTLITPEGSDSTEIEPVVTVKIREVISTRSGDIFTVTCTVTDAATGLVTFPLPTGVTRNAGVYTAEFAALNLDDDLILSNSAFIWVDRGLYGNPKFPNAGPPTIDEIRLHIRDNAPEENRLLDDFEYDLSEICQATELGVRYWNEAQPPIDVNFTTCSYCARDRWLQVITGRMLQMAAHRFRRNHLPYQSGGISVDDQNKFQIYDQMGQMMIQDYRLWVRSKKVQINSTLAITSTGSLYGSTAYTLLNTGG